jgi:hypothetical protein
LGEQVRKASNIVKHNEYTFRKIEPYLTFLNIHQLERHGADILSKVIELEEANQCPRERDKNKDDAITMLSNQPLTITETKGIENKIFSNNILMYYPPYVKKFTRFY